MTNTFKSLAFAILACVQLFHAAHADDSVFRKVHLPDGVSIEIPRHWTVLSQDTRKNIAAAGRAMTDNAGIEGDSNQKQTLLAVNATPAPTGAMIRVSVTVPPDYSQRDLANVTPRELKEVEREMLMVFKKMEVSGGPVIVEMQRVQVEPFKNTRAVAIRYVRTSKNGPSPWHVTQYKIPVDNRLIELTLSYRQSDSVLWRPILERVKQSILF